MALQIRRKKQQGATPQHKNYMGGAQRTWMDDEREQGGASMRRTFWYIIIVAVVILIILVVSVVAAAFSSTSTEERTITASDTFAVSQREQTQMMDYAQTFARGMLLYAYCSDADTAQQGKAMAMSVMANNTDSYKTVEAMDANTPLIEPANFVPVVTEPVMEAGTQSYAGSYVYTLDGGAADASVVSEQNPDGTFADAGYHFTLRFDLVTNEANDEEVWVISDAQISER